MNCKICPFCQQPSYSAATFGRWTCPHCQQDMTFVEFSPLNHENTLSKTQVAKDLEVIQKS